MKRLKKIFYLLAGLFLLLVLTGAFFTVSETQQAVILQLGKPVRVICGDRTPEQYEELQTWMDENAPGVVLSMGSGLYFKIPLLQQVRIFDDRILEYDDEPADVVTRDKKHIQVDSYARWKIHNPLLFLTSVQTVSSARSRLDDIIYSVLRQELGKSDLIHIVRSTNDPVGIDQYVRLVSSVSYADTLENIVMDERGEVREVIRMIRLPVSQGRDDLLQRVTDSCRILAMEYGIYIIDVRIKRADLPHENQLAVFTRMQAERNRISTLYRAEGRRIARTIIANADLKIDSIMASANYLTLTIHGEADSLAAAIYADAYSSYPDFYRFVNSLETITAILDSTDQVILSSEGIFEYLASRPGEFQ